MNSLAALLPRGASLAAIAACHVAAIAAIAGGGFEPATIARSTPFVVELLAPPARVAPPLARPVARPVAEPVSPRKISKAPDRPRSKPKPITPRPRPPEPPRKAAAATAAPSTPAPEPSTALEPPSLPQPPAVAPEMVALAPPIENALDAEAPAAEIARQSITPASFEASYLRNPKPRYPLAARRMGQQGTVVLHVDVTAAGEVKDLSVSESSGHARLDRVALEAVSSWRFVAARRGAIAVASSIQVPIVFKLEK